LLQTPKPQASNNALLVNAGATLRVLTFSFLFFEEESQSRRQTFLTLRIKTNHDKCQKRPTTAFSTTFNKEMDAGLISDISR
jgi:hypothetical protein